LKDKHSQINKKGNLVTTALQRLIVYQTRPIGPWGYNNRLATHIYYWR